MTPSIATCVIHAPWIPERVATMARLRQQLFMSAFGESVANLSSPYREETTRCPGAWWVWSELAWTWLVEQDVTHCLVLQDDVEVAPAFWPALHTMIAKRPEQVLVLDNPHPAARSIFAQGLDGYESCDGLVGIGYVLPRHLLHAFLEWRLTALKPFAFERVTEDCLIGLWAMATRRRFWHPVPTIIDHDVEIPSTNAGHDEHIYRRPQVTWRDVDRPHATIDGGAGFGPPPYLGRFYETLHWLLPIHLSDTKLGEQLANEYQAEHRCPVEYRKYFQRCG